MSEQIDESSMKTQAQILRYVSQCQFHDEDWLEVLVYCRKKFGGGKAHRALKPLSGSTYQQFLDWIDNGIAVGDIVRYGHTVGIVGGYSPDAAYLSAFLSSDGGLVQTKLEVAPYKLFKAQSSEIQSFNQALIDNQLAFSVSTSSFYEAFYPDNGDFVRITLGKRTLLGIYKGSEDENHLFYLITDSKKINTDQQLPKADCILQLPSKSDNLSLLNALSNNGLEWSPQNKSLHKVSDGRAVKLSRYYYVTDTMDIASEKDMHTKVHDRRFKCGNYFRNFQEAFNFRERIVQLRKEITGEQ